MLVPRWQQVVGAYELLTPGSAIRFDEVEGGLRPKFAEAAAPAGRHHARVTLPVRANEPFVVRDEAHGVGVRVQLEGAKAERYEAGGGFLTFASAGPALRDGGRADVLLRPTAEGAEDFVYFAGAPEDERITYRVALEGATELRRSNDTASSGLFVVDSNGARRIEMHEPWLIDASGQRHAADVVVDGCMASAGDGAAMCTVVVDWSERSVRYPVLLDPAWELTFGSMFSPRTKHTSTTLSSGDVLIVGGFNPADGAAQDLAEIYRAAVDVFDEVSFVTHVLATARGEHTATHIPGPPEQVLVAGGYDAEGGALLGDAELYDVASNTFSTVADPLGVPRAGHTATLLANGTVLLAGGTGTQPELAEIYDPATGQFTTLSADPMTQPRRYHTATLLSDDTVLLAGGFGPTFTTATAEIYATGVGFTALASTMTSPRAHGTATTLLDGRVLLGGGTNGVEHYSTADTFDVGSSTFQQTTPMAEARSRHTASRLPTGLVVLTGGQNATGALAETELFDPMTGAFTADATMSHRRVDHAASSLASGQVVVTGGTVGNPASSAELLKRSNGDACAVASECASGKCAPDGVCCDSECTDACDRCTEAITGVPDGVCSPVPSGTPAAGPNSAQCTDSIAFVLSCDGAGNVAIEDLIDCKPFGCDADDQACSDTCDVDSGCDDSAFCDLSQSICVDKLPDGAPCASGTECESAFCADGRCCNVACDGTCESCAQAGTEGECRLIQGQPIAGKACPEATDADCAGSCDGLQVECVFPDAACGSSSCSEGTERSGICNQGSCEAQVLACEEYTCDVGGIACRNRCDVDGHCSAGFICTSDGQCAVIEAATCSGNVVKLPNGDEEDCAPYVCLAAECRDSCRSIQDCIEPFVCNPEGRCVAAPSPPVVPDSCSVGSLGRDDDGSWGFETLWLLGLAGLARRRRERRAAEER